MGDLKIIDRVQFSKNSFEFYSNMHSFDIQRESSVYFTTFTYLVKKEVLQIFVKSMLKKNYNQSIGFYLINLEISINFIYSKQKHQMQYLNIRIWQGMLNLNPCIYATMFWLHKFLFRPDFLCVQGSNLETKILVHYTILIRFNFLIATEVKMLF